MFSTFKILVIYLIIPSRYANILPPSGDKTTFDSQEQVKKELDPLKDSFKKIMDSLLSVELKVELGVIQGRVEKIIERLVKVEKENKILIKNQGVLEKEKDYMQDNALKLFVVPYFCQKFELYGEHWDPKVVNIENFDPNDVTGTSLMKRDLDDQTRASYRDLAKKWNRILCSSTHPLAIRFKTALEKKFPDVPLSTLAKDLGLAIALLNNTKHGVIANDPELQELLQIDSAISALSKWASLSDPVILDVIYEFEKEIQIRKYIVPALPN